MFQPSSQPYVQSRTRTQPSPTGPAVTTNSGAPAPVCPECRSSLNRVPRRFIDRVLSLIYPVHRYHCRSFVCNWEGNLPYTNPETDHWDELEADSASDSVRPPSPVSGSGSDAAAPVRAREARTAGSDQRAREGDTLPMPQSSSAPDASAGSREVKKAPRRAKKRAQADPR
jgi:hypothetical protein